MFAVFDGILHHVLRIVDEEVKWVAKMPQVFERKSYYGTKQDEMAIRLIRETYGLSTDSDAIRLALRLLATPEAIKTSLAQRPLKKALHYVKREEEI